MSSGTKEKAAFAVPPAGPTVSTKNEPAKSAGPKLERPFTPCDLHGFSDDDLRAVLTFKDIIDPDRTYYARHLSDITAMSEQQAFEVMNGRDKDGRSNIEDTRGFMGLHPCAFGYRVLEFLQRRPDIRPHFNEFALAAYRRTHVELFREHIEPNLTMLMRLKRDEVEREKREAEQRKAAAILNEKWQEAAEIFSRFPVPTHDDAARMLGLASELKLDEAEIDRTWRWLKSVWRRQQRVDAAHSKGARLDEKSEDLIRLRKSAAARPAFFDTSGDYPKLRFPPVMTD